MQTAAVTDCLSLAGFLALDPRDDRRYELNRGQLQEMPTESDLNLRIASLIFAQLLQLGIPPSLARSRL
ncbi:MAG: hypothetical protein ACFB9N_07940 [Geitlerinemataceae cyanobacterium]